MKYRIITSKTLHGIELGLFNFHTWKGEGGLVDLVNSEMEKGWRPIGGILLIQSEHGQEYGQAMLLLS
jgi:hypothetical protein